MRRWTPHRIHKWIAVSAGLFFSVWTVSGIIMILPDFIIPRFRPPAPEPLELGDRGVAPEAAVRYLEEELGKSPEITRLSLRRIEGVLVYEIALSRGGTHLIDARGGSRFLVDPDLAKRISRKFLPLSSRDLKIERVQNYSYDYQGGPLPAYRVWAEDQPSVACYVSVQDGSVSRQTRWTRLAGAIGRLHTFDPVKLVFERDAVRKLLLFLTSIVAIGAVATGYYLALPRRRDRESHR